MVMDFVVAKLANCEIKFLAIKTHYTVGYETATQITRFCVASIIMHA